jgi:aspartokinase
VLASCLGADELIFVKDVGGVFTADPSLIPESEKLLEISAIDAHLLSSGGAKIFHDKVFRLKKPDLNIRIISKEEDLSETGSIVVGGLPDLEIFLADELIHEVSLIGCEAKKSNMIQNILEKMTPIGLRINRIEVGKNSLRVSLTNDARAVFKTFHEFLNKYDLKGASIKENLINVKIQGKKIDQIKTRIPVLLNEHGVHSIYADVTQVSLTVDQSSLEEIIYSLTTQNFSDCIN